MIIAIYDTDFDPMQIELFNSYSEYYARTFSPGVYVHMAIDTDKTPHGKTYNDKKNALRDTAINFYNLFPMFDISYLEFVTATNYFEKYARRYGLITEFTENAII